MGQPPLFLVALGPRVTEIDVNAVHLSRGEKLRQQRRVRVNEKHIGEPLLRHPLHSHHHGVRHLFHGDEQGVRLGLGGSGGEAPLAAAQLYLQPLRLGIQLPPPSPHSLRLPDPAVPAGLHTGL